MMIWNAFILAIESILRNKVRSALTILGVGLTRMMISTFVICKNSLEVIALAFVVAVVIGIVFGIVPARKASRLNPVDALRHE